MGRKTILVGLAALCLAACGGAATAVVGTVPPSLPPATKTATLTPTKTPLPTGTLAATSAIFVREGTPPVKPEEPITSENAHRIVELARWGYGTINEVQHSSDGRFMFVQTAMGVYAYNAGTLDEVWRFAVDEGASAMGVSPDGKYVALGTYVGPIYLLNSADGQAVDYLVGHTDEVLSIAFSPDGTLLASGGNDNKARLWQLDCGGDFKSKRDIYFDYSVDRVIFGGNGNLLAIRVRNREAGIAYRLWDIDGEILLNRVDRHYSAISLEFDMYYNGGEGAEIRRFSDKEVVTKLAGIDAEKFYGHGAAFSKDGDLIAVGDSLGSVRVWRVEDGALIAILETNPMFSYSSGHLTKPALRSGPGPGAIYSLNFNSDDNLLVATNGSGNIFVWEFETGDLRTMIKDGFGKSFFSPSNNQVISYDWNGQGLAVFEVSTGERVDGIYEGWIIGSENSDHTLELLFSPDGTRLAVGSNLWTIEEGKKLELPWGEKALAFNENGQSLYTIRRQWWITKRATIDLVLREQVQLTWPTQKFDDEWHASDYSWWELGGWCISPDEKTVRAGIYESPYLIWALESGKVIDTIGFTSEPLCRFSPGGHYSVELGDGVIIRERQADGNYEKKHTIGLGASDFDFHSPNELIISTDMGVVVYDLVSGVILEDRNIALDEYRYISQSAISPDGSLLAISVNDGIIIWDFNENKEVYSFMAHFNSIWSIAIRSIAFSPDGLYLATRSWDGTIRLWGIAP